jgi:serpin B
MDNAAFTKTIGLTCVLALAVAGCGSGGKAPVEVETARSSVVRVVDPQVSVDDANTFSADNAAFAFAAYGKLKTETGNLVFSPISISIALAMAYAGAAGDTATEMATALHFSLPPARLHPAFDALDLALAARGEGAQGADGGPMRLRMVNSAWGEKTYVFRSDYLDMLAANYGAGVNLMDFIGAPEPSRLLINDWVAQQTEDKITDLIPQGSIDSATRLVLTNAIYFNAAWKHPFDPQGTDDRPFTRLDGSQVSVKMMSDAYQMSAVATPDVKAIVLPYQDERLSLLVVVPEPGKFEQVEASLGVAWLDTLISGLSSLDAYYQIPRFKVDTTAPVKNALIALGMSAAFDSGLADFSGIDGTRSLFVQDVRHKAFIAVGEKGTEAAAATAVILGGGVPDIFVTANRPFFYFLRDEPTGAILFMGRVMDPSV